ncbi:GTP-binding protein YPT1 [Stylophora pistillata]|uniref:GTP-binding protein YPT1 n=1 Tax=Stylophora pistillata TaxID=50429 RepID=A0A2B4RQ46_STYPI|nr:GTP-binding protein YPT1 [Stylophora pistillata]
MDQEQAEEESLESHVRDLVLEREIGKGSYGKVYKALWNGREVAAKRFHAALANSGYSEIIDQIREEFQREWEILKSLNHPNVVKFYGVEFPKGRLPIIITELLHCDLERFIRESKSSPKVPTMNLLCIALDVIQGLQYMHGLGNPIVHRDLATKNILLTHAGTAKIADLGVAKEFVQGYEMYATPVRGTLVYAAPETYPVMVNFEVVDNAKYGPKVDIFSFGVMLLAMAVGHEPKVSSLSPITKDGKKISEHERRKTDIDEMGDHLVQSLVLRCLENDSECRPSAKDIKAELEKHKWNLVWHSDCYEMDEEAVIEKVERQPTYDYKFKILFIGNGGVGKSCLFQRFQDPRYNIGFSTTTIGLGIDFESFKYGSKFVHLEVVDTAGQEYFFALQAMYFRGVHGIFLVCDVTNRETFHHIPKWLDVAHLYCTETNALVILIGNKIDQEKKREVSREEGEKFAKCHGLSYLEVSALDVEKIEHMFKTMIRLLTRSVDLGTIKIELAEPDNKRILERLHN